MYPVIYYYACSNVWLNALATYTHVNCLLSIVSLEIGVAENIVFIFRCSPGWCLIVCVFSTSLSIKGPYVPGYQIHIKCRIVKVELLLSKQVIFIILSQLIDADVSFRCKARCPMRFKHNPALHKTPARSSFIKANWDKYQFCMWPFYFIFMKSL